MNLRLVVNNAESAIGRHLNKMFPGFFIETKHNHYADFGYPTNLSFQQFFDMYERNGIARAGVNKTILKTWQDLPFIQDHERDDGEEAKETTLEKDIRLRLRDMRGWTALMEADRRSLVGAFGGVILRLADGKLFDQPVDRVGGGLAGLVEMVPFWEGQLKVSEWVMDQADPDYGKPKMYQFNEAAFNDPVSSKQRAFNVHPDRILVWSVDGTTFGTSLLKAGYNDLMTMEKIVGAGGEGFWKNAKSAPIFEVDKEANLQQMAQSMGIKPEEIADKMDEQVEAFNKGFDKMLMVQGMKANTLGITLPSPEHFFAIALQGFAASVPIPLKILVGSQTGERASTEDAAEWAQTNMARREGTVIPMLLELLKRLVRFGILPQKDWHIDWTDLTEATADQKIDRADKMAGVNQKLKDSGEWVFTTEEIREAVDMQPLSEAEKYREPPVTDEEGSSALGGLGGPKP